MCTKCETTQDAQPVFGRRHFFGLAAAMAAMSAGVARADCTHFDAESLKAISPDQAIQFLVEGNARFVAGQSLHCDQLALGDATAEKQTPFACVLACMDSRSSPELVLDQQIGDIFVARVAGNVATTEVIGSFEYGAKVAGAKAIMVLGHSHCGAVKGAIDKAVVGDALTTLLDEIEPAVAATPLTGERSSKNAEFVEGVAEANVRLNVAALTEKSPVLKELVEAGQLKIVGGIYDLETGVVTLLS
ncbi:MAG: carbonic anhydrase family protein [Pseudomonadota bacterium]